MPAEKTAIGIPPRANKNNGMMQVITLVQELDPVIYCTWICCVTFVFRMPFETSRWRRPATIGWYSKS